MDLEAILAATRTDHWAPIVKVLVAEVVRLRSILSMTYSQVVSVPGTEAAQAELEQEVTAIRQEGRRRTVV